MSMPAPCEILFNFQSKFVVLLEHIQCIFKALFQSINGTILEHIKCIEASVKTIVKCVWGSRGLPPEGKK